MPCIDSPTPAQHRRAGAHDANAAALTFMATSSGMLRLRALVTAAALVVLAGCANKPVASPAAPAPVAAAAKPAPTTTPPSSTAAAAVLPNAAQPVAPTPANGATGKPGSTPRYVTLGPPAVSRNWTEYKLQAARRMVAAHPDTSHMGKPQPLLLGIPVLEIELNGDGSVRKVSVLREPQEAKDTIQLAIDAVRRAGPYGDVSKLPKPWKFIETFLFNSDYRFKPRTLD